MLNIFLPDQLRYNEQIIIPLLTGLAFTPAPILLSDGVKIVNGKVMLSVRQVIQVVIKKG
jgi:hypothetical protein